MRYIAIDGRGGSGKTYLAHLLAKHLHATVYHLDDYGNDYEPFIGIPKLIDELARASADVVVFEGVGVFDPRFDRFDAFRIFVDTPAEIRRLRATGRDVPRADRTSEEWSRIWDIWRDAEQHYFTPALSAAADLVTGQDGQFDIQDILLRIRENS